MTSIKSPPSSSSQAPSAVVPPSLSVTPPSPPDSPLSSSVSSSRASPLRLPRSVERDLSTEERDVSPSLSPSRHSPSLNELLRRGRQESDQSDASTGKGEENASSSQSIVAMLSSRVGTGSATPQQTRVCICIFEDVCE